MFKAIQRIRVEWSHCDPARIIFNPNYYIWMDQGTHRLFEAADFGFGEIVRDRNARGFPLVSSGAEYLSPARYGDVLQLASEVVSLGRTSLRLEHEFSCDDNVVAKGFEIRVFGAVPPDDPDGLIARPLTEKIKTQLSRNEIVVTTIS